ncbi:hypothetical protein [Viridibacillus arvi]|uniref:hypothetical protein n=1 Tax=Viridibacillus arvi TaxID=263475 RepID=UPI0034CE3D8C
MINLDLLSPIELIELQSEIVSKIMGYGNSRFNNENKIVTKDVGWETGRTEFHTYLEAESLKKPSVDAPRRDLLERLNYVQGIHYSVAQKRYKQAIKAK